ncbi:hypothetical protein D3C81_1648240 [compost metagenome]
MVLNSSGRNFISVDHGTALNVDKVTCLDRSIRAACFEVDPRSDSPKCLMAVQPFRKLCAEIDVPLIGEEPIEMW